MKLSHPRLSVLFTPEYENATFVNQRHTKCWGKDIALMAAISGSIVERHTLKTEILQIAICQVQAKWKDNFTSRLAAITVALLCDPNHTAIEMEFLPTAGNLAEMFTNSYARKVFGNSNSRQARFGKDMGLITLLAGSAVSATPAEVDATATTIMNTAIFWNSPIMTDATAQALLQLHRPDWPRIMGKTPSSDTPERLIAIDNVHRAIEKIRSSVIV